MKQREFTKRALTVALTVLIAQSSLSFAANKAMEDKGYFEPKLYAERNKPVHAISHYRTRLNLTSLRQGMPKQAVPLLWQESSPGRQSVMDSLLDNLDRTGINTKSIKRMDENKRRLAAYGDGWKLKVYGDGSRATFRNYGHMEKNEAAMGKLTPLKPDQLIKLGQRFISGVLGEQIRLSEKEALVPFGLQYQINAQQAVDSKQKPEKTTVAAAIVFSRTINGVDVLGKGSKVAVLFANDGTPFGFDFDWPRLYSAGVDQKVASLDELKRRAIKVSRLEGHEINVQLDRFECGYYDAGEKKRGETPMQPACFHFYSAQSKAATEDGATGLLSMAYVDAVPAGTEIIADANWDIAQELLYGPSTVPERSKPGKNSELREKLRNYIPTNKESRY
jgi:hypothetical protein